MGLPKTGTTYLQGLLAENRDRLREAGVLYPFVRPGGMFHGAVDVRGSHEKFGLDADLVAGTWAELCARARAFEGTTLLGHEVLGGATPEQVAAALDPLAGLEVHVVVTARDLGRQSTAHWQEEVKLGDARSFADLEREELRADTGRDAGPDAGGRRPRFWHAQDAADALRRWTSAGLPLERAHLVVVPPPGAPADELWRRFAEAAGIDAGVLDPTSAPAANPSLGVAEVALLRAVNRELAGRLPAGEYHRLVKRGWAETELAGSGGRRPRTPSRLADVLGAATDRWVEEVRAGGYAVHGRLEELAPVLAGPDEPDPDELLPGEARREDPARLAEQLLAAARGAEAPRRSLLRRLGRGRA